MDTTQYPHPWEQDQDLTDRLLKLVEDEDWDFFGIALFDTGIRFADAAADCGMGYIGKSNVLVTEKYGPRINMTYLIGRINKQHGVHTIEWAEKIGLGSRKYHMVDIDRK